MREFSPLDIANKHPIVFCAIPSNAIEEMLPALQAANKAQPMQGILFVDVSNSSSECQPVALKLQDALPASHVVKAFNTVSAFDLIFGNHRQIFISGNVISANSTVKEIATCMELLLVGALWFATTIYAGSRYLEIGCWGAYPFAMFTLYILDNTICWTSMWSIGLVYLLGDIAEISPKPLYPGFVNLLHIRKNIANIAYVLLCLHVFISVLIFGPSYHGKFYDAETGKLKLKMEVSMLGIFGFVFMTFTAMTSVLSVWGALSWKEWRFVQFWLGQGALFLDMTHTVVMGAGGWSKIGT